MPGREAGHQRPVSLAAYSLLDHYLPGLTRPLVLPMGFVAIVITLTAGFVLVGRQLARMSEKVAGTMALLARVAKESTESDEMDPEAVH